MEPARSPPDSTPWTTCSRSRTGLLACLLIPPAHARIPAHPATGAPWHLRRLRAAGDVRGESGMLLRQMLLAARRTLDARCVVGAAHQLLKLRPAIVTAIFKNRHRWLLHYKRTDAIHDAAHLGGGAVVIIHQDRKRHPLAAGLFRVARKRAHPGARTGFGVDVSRGGPVAGHIHRS